MNRVVSIVVMALVLAVGHGPCVRSVAAAADNPVAERNQAVRDLAARTLPSFVFVSGGSGVLISEDGLLLTNAHVIGEGQRTFTVRIGDGRSFQAKVLGYHEFGDVALLQIQGGSNLPCLPLGDSDAVQVGDFCMAIGNPLALGMLDQTPTVSIGVLSMPRHMHGNYSDSLVTDTPINPGNSGGPLINARGELIGINGQIRTRMGLRSNTGLGFAIPVNRIKLWLPLLKAAKGRAITHGKLEGIEWEEAGVDGQLAYIVPTIRSVASGSDADRVGFKAGDKVLTCQGQSVRVPVQLYMILAMLPTTEPMNVEVEREGSRQTLMFRLDPIEK